MTPVKSTRAPLAAGLLLGLAAAVIPNAPPAPGYDVILRYGLIVDGTGAP